MKDYAILKLAPLFLLILSTSACSANSCNDISYLISPGVSGEILICQGRGEESVRYEKDSSGRYTLLISKSGKIIVQNSHIDTCFKNLKVSELGGSPVAIYLNPPKRTDWDDNYDKGFTVIGTNEEGCFVLFFGDKNESSQYLSEMGFW